MKNPIRPVLMFSGERHGQAEEAVRFYTSIFPNSRVVAMSKYGADQHEPEGTVELATFVINGQEFLAMDSDMPHPFNFTPSISFFLTAETISEFDVLVDELCAGGQMLMPPGNYGFSQKFAWLNDRYGVSWQINCD